LGAITAADASAGGTGICVDVVVRHIVGKGNECSKQVLSDCFQGGICISTKDSSNFRFTVTGSAAMKGELKHW
jgi:hypothetical protein